MEEELARMWVGFSLTDQETQELILPSTTLNNAVTKGDSASLL